MATNRNAVIRYNTLDKCFQNFGRKYYFKDLLDIVNEALLDFDPNSAGIKTRQLRDDIRFMKSDAGYSAPIETYPDGRKAYYRYESRDYSINNSPLNTTEAEQLKNAIAVLNRFEGSPEFEWVTELTPILNDKFGLKNESQKVMEFDSNIDYSGYEHITPIFNAISNEIVLKVKYQPFGQEAHELTFHPYYLKQYNNRWFAFGKNDYNGVNTWNLALDRIIQLEDSSITYVKEDIDWVSYFEDMIGVSKPVDVEVQKIELLFTPEQAPYIQTKPIHLTQKHKLQEDGYLKVTLEIIPNYELTMKLLSYGEKVKIISPKSLLNDVKSRLKQASKQYKS